MNFPKLPGRVWHYSCRAILVGFLDIPAEHVAAEVAHHVAWQSDT